jgi:hypothetical protein
MPFPLQNLYSNKIKITVLPLLDDTYTNKSDLKNKSTDIHHDVSPISFSFITVSEENIHSCPHNKECHYHLNWFNTFIQKKTSNLSIHCYGHTILQFCINSQ